jgi:hypothetical protein
MTNMWPWIGVFVAVQFVLVEILLTVTWNRWYFTKGIPLMAWRAKVPASELHPPSAAAFEQKFHSKMFAPLLFREMEPDVYGFREESGRFRWFGTVPVMRGKIIFDRQRRQIFVVGYANWSIVAFCTGFIGFAATMSGQNGGVAVLGPASFLTLFFVPPYIIQRQGFVNVGKYAVSAAASPDCPGASLNS